MKHTVLKVIPLLLIFALSSCNEDDIVLNEGLPDAIINTDPEGSPPRGLTESWNDHTEVLNRQIFESDVAVYYDDATDRSIEWPFTFFPSVWTYTTSTYGSFGSNNTLYVVGHGTELNSFYKTYFEEDAGNRNIIDFNLTSEEPTAKALDSPVSLLAQLVENANNGVSGSPASAVWQDKFQEIFTYDLYLSIGRDADAERVKALYSSESAGFPAADTFWFRDWFLPLYEANEGAALLNNFFTVLSANYPIDGGKYARDMNLGELVHFFSGATGEDLEPLAVSTLGFTEANMNELLQARAEFPELNYPFEPASELTDVTSDGVASIEVSKDNGAGPEGNEGSLKLIDGDFNSKFLTDGFPQEFFVQQVFEAGQVANRYTLTSGNDAPDRDFKNWELLGSNDGIDFTVLDTRTDETFSERNQTREFLFENSTPYRFYRINLLENNGSNLVQISEWRLLNLKLLTFGPEDVSAVATLTVSAENRDGADAGEGSTKLVDGDTTTKFLVFDFVAPLQMVQSFGEAQRVTEYTITSANDAPDRDPVSWTLSASNDGETYELLDTRENQTFDQRELTRVFIVDNSEAYTSYRLEVQANGGGALFQVAEWRLFAE